jgi:SAM-dependent methyltransferase
MLLPLSLIRHHEHRLVQTLYQQIPESGFPVIRNSYNFRPTSTGSVKHLDLGSTLAEAVREPRRLGLLDSHGLWVLDLGCGTGYSLYFVRCFEHNVLGLDVDTDPLYNDTTQILRVPRIGHPFRRFERLPELGRPFDFITACSICLDCRDSRDLWLEHQWAFFQTTAVAE